MAKPRHKFQVFVSSTFSDLHEERAEVTWAILKARHIPAGMENFPASDDRGWATIRRTIDDSDYYVLLLAGRYGSVDLETGISWTEREYNYALEKQIPVLSFVRDRASTPGNMVDTDNKAEKLTSLIDRVRNSHLCSTWKTRDDLAGSVVQSLQRAIQDAEDEGKPRPGWTRGDLGGPEVASEIARLSKENAELRAMLDAVRAQESKPKLVLFLNGEPVPEAWEPELDQYVPEEPTVSHMGFMTRGANNTEFAALASRTLWVPLEVVNSGLAPARNVKVTATLETSAGTLGDTIINRFLRSTSFVVADAGKWRFDPTEPTYVSNHGQGYCEQRLKTIGVSQRERLLRIGFVLPEEFLRGGIVNLKLTVEAWSEDGAQAKGEISVRPLAGSKVVLTQEVLDEL